MIITKKYETETAHIVRGASSIRCRTSWHGHTYTWEISIEGPRNANGMVIDFIDLKPIKTYIDMFDHCIILWSKDSQEVIDFYTKNSERYIIMNNNPTAENMVALTARWINSWLAINYPKCKLHNIKIWETRTGSAEGIEFDDTDILVLTSPYCEGRL